MLLQYVMEYGFQIPICIAIEESPNFAVINMIIEYRWVYYECQLNNDRLLNIFSRVTLFSLLSLLLNSQKTSSICDYSTIFLLCG